MEYINIYRLFCFVSGVILANLTFLKTIQADLVEVVFLRYELSPSLHATINEQHQNSTLSFSVCACSVRTYIALEMKKPDPKNCLCKDNIIGQSTQKNKAIYPASCLINPGRPSKCLAARIHGASSKYIYVRISQGGAKKDVLTYPEWQSIETKKRKTVVKLSAKKIYTNQTEHVVEPESYITIAYEVQSIPMVSVGQVTEFFGPYKPFSKYGMKNQKSNEQTPSSTVATIPTKPKNKHYSPAPTSSYSSQHNPLLRSRMGTDMNGIERFLFEDGQVQQIHPHHFDVEEFKNAIIRIHNRYRRIHGATDLQYDNQCERAAKRWGEVLATMQSCLRHETQQKFGENLFLYTTSEPMFSTPETMAEATMHSFYIEGVNYRYDMFNPGAIHDIGHFTQMIWRSSKRVGVGVVIRKHVAGEGVRCFSIHGGWTIYVVIRYDPPGNFLSDEEFFENVKPAIY